MGTVNPRVQACVLDDVWMQAVGMGELADPGETQPGQQDWERELGKGGPHDICHTYLGGH